MSDNDPLFTDSPLPDDLASVPEADLVINAQADGNDSAPTQSQLDEQRDKYLRLAAEFENFRRRTAKERAEAEVRGQAEMLKGLIEPLDDIARFAHVDPATTDSKTLVEGVAMVEKKLAKTLLGHGLEVVDPVGQPFNPAQHEAVMTEPATAPEEDHLVARVFQLGYVFNGQLIRPARVVVKQWNG